MERNRGGCLLRIGIASVSLAWAGALTAAQADAFAIPQAEFAKYHEAITGTKPAADAVRFAIDPAISAKGNDAYAIRSDAKGAVLTGSNARSVLYAVYDLLERRGGCRWFWDGDVVPKRASVDLSGLDVREESQHEFRGIRYFAHRGLTRFQAEHWGLEDWKREIDWCVKKRLNVMMLRIGQDDVFQRAFPDVCAYPDPSKPLPATGKGYNNRSLFWPLEFRGKLREQVIAYAHARGLKTPEDCGTMTHWYSRTPLDFVQKMKPDYFTEKGAAYNDGKGTGLVWDIRQQKWIDAYWRLTETALRTYDNGDDTLLHTMGVGERKFSDGHEENIRTKLMIDKKVVDEALKRHPNTRVLYPGWDFYYQWRGEDVKKFVSMLDPEKTVVWQYTSDSYKEGKSNPLEWGIVGKFPYTFGIFLAYESGLDVRANYDLIRAREAASKDDPFCVGYILWPESSHTDLLAAEYFAANAWRIDDLSTADRIASFCRDRYGEKAATFEPIWRDVVPVSTNALQETWRSNYGIALLNLLGDSWNNANNDPSRWPARPLTPFAKAPEIFRALAAVDWRGDVVRRDTVDLARTVGDRLTLAAEQNMMDAYFRWKAGDAAAVADFERAAADAEACAELMRRVLALHTDFSLNDSLARLNAVEPVRNPDFGQVLLENAVNSYCASHQAEPAEHLYPQVIAHVAAEIRARIRTGSKEPLDAKGVIALKDAFLKRPLASLKSREARTSENYRQTMLDFAEAAEKMLQTVSGAEDFVPQTRDGCGIQKAIDAAAAAGGGRVVLEKATYPSGTIYLKSNVELHLPEGATLLGHDTPDGYDDVDDPRIGKLPENSKKVFIVAMDATNVAITGRGTIDGRGPAFYDRNIPSWRSFYLKPPHPRPRMVEMYKCRNVRFEGVLFKDSPGWTFWIRNCEDVLAKGIRIHGDQKMINNDGLHLDGCKRMRVLGCDFRTGDDSIVFRAIEPPDHDPYDALGEDLYVADCTIDSACQGVRLGCPSDNTIRKAVFTNCVFRGRSAVQSGHPVRYIRKGTGFPKGNCRMEDILFVDCTVDVHGPPIRFFAEDGVALRKYGNVTFRRMTLKGGEPIELTGNPEAVVENVRFEDVSGEIADKTPVLMCHTRNIAFERFDVSCVPPRPGKVDHRVKVGLYCDRGSRGDNVVRWTRLLDESPDVALTLLEGGDLRSGKLSGLDLLVMPGGSGYDQYASMGENGAQAIRDYVRGGGKYLGTCAGLALLLNEANRVALLPLRRIDGHFRRGGGDLGVEFTDAGMKTLGITNRVWAVRYHNGPIVVPAAAVEGTACETLATCRNGIHEQGVSPKRDDMVGTPAFVRATCGKGEVVACNCHPEAYPATRELAVAMIRVLTGRTIHPPAKYFRSYRASGKGALQEAVRYNE